MTEEDLLNTYFNGVKIGKPISSPLREGDNKPSFLFYYNKSNRICGKDYGTGETISLIDLILRLNPNLGLIDLNVPRLNKYLPKFQIKKNNFYNNFIIKNNHQSIKIKRKEWTKECSKYWIDYGIDINDELLKKTIIPISFFSVNDTIYKCDKIAFAYRVKIDNIYHYKIYQPFNKNNMKWRNTIPSSYMFLFEKKCNTIVITSSVKDCLVLYNNTKSSTCCFNSETYNIKDSDIEKLKEKGYSKFFIVYDNDKTGIDMANKVIEKYPFVSSFIVPNGLYRKGKELKDPSDFYKTFKHLKLIKNDRN